MLKKARKEGKLKTKKQTSSSPPRQGKLLPQRARIPRCSQYNMDELDGESSEPSTFSSSTGDKG